MGSDNRRAQDRSVVWGADERIRRDIDLRQIQYSTYQSDIRTDRHDSALARDDGGWWMWNFGNLRRRASPERKTSARYCFPTRLISLMLQKRLRHCSSKCCIADLSLVRRRWHTKMLRRFVPVLNVLERFASHHLMDDSADDNPDERTNGTKPSLYLGVSDPRFPGRSQSWQEREPHEKVERPTCQTSLLG